MLVTLSYLSSFIQSSTLTSHAQDTRVTEDPENTSKLKRNLNTIYKRNAFKNLFHNGDENSDTPVLNHEKISIILC